MTDAADISPVMDRLIASKVTHTIIDQLRAIPLSYSPYTRNLAHLFL